MKAYDDIPVRFVAERLAAFDGVDFYFVTRNTDEGENNSAETEEDEAHADLNPVRSDATFRNELMALADAQETPLIYSDEQQIAYVCVKNEAAYFFFGPIALRALNRVELHRFYRQHGVKNAEDKPLPILSVSRIVMLAQAAAGILQKRAYTGDELLKANAGNQSYDERSDQEAFRFSLREEDRENDHHTYQEERRITDAVSEGRTEDAVRFSMAMDDSVGEVAAGYLEQTRKTAIISITVCTRAAMRGGISPTEAYQISDFYMQKLDQCTDEASMTACRNEAIRTLTDRVRLKKEQKARSTYVEACCDYIGKHYREKIYLDDLAKKMGISPTYLSRLFSKEVGVTIQDYVVGVRVERAANLLTYSSSSIAEIGDYVNFPSQSYFGKVFKKYKSMTPKQYRNAHKPKEFS